MTAAHLDSMLKNVIESSHSDLQTLKQAVWQVSLRLARGTPHGATTDEDRVACTMSFLWCADRADVVRQLLHAGSYPLLRSLADPADPYLRQKAS